METELVTQQLIDIEYHIWCFPPFSPILSLFDREGHFVFRAVVRLLFLSLSIDLISARVRALSPIHPANGRDGRRPFSFSILGCRLRPYVSVSSHLIGTRTLLERAPSAD